MKRSINPGPSLKVLRQLWQQLGSTEVAAEVEAAEAAVEVVVEEARMVEEVTTVVVATNKKARRVRVRRRSTPNTKPPDMLTNPHSRPAGAIGPMGNLLIIVKIRVPAPGKTFGCPSQTCNETGTSSATKMTSNLYKTRCTEVNKK